MYLFTLPLSQTTESDDVPPPGYAVNDVEAEVVGARVVGAEVARAEVIGAGPAQRRGDPLR